MFLFFSLFSDKLRKNIRIRSRPPKIDQSIRENTFWFHASSVGEYEQIRPLILKIKKENQSAFICVSVLSYSGYIQCKGDQIFHVFFPLPFDLYFRTKKLIKKIKPKFIFYSRYDVWPNMVRIAHKKGVQQILVSATLSDDSLRKQVPFSFIYSKIYGYLDQIFTVDTLHQNHFLSMNLKAQAVGDTRYDSIQNRINNIDYQEIDVLKVKTYASKRKKKIMIAGSSYKTSENFFIGFMKNFADPPLLILVPHDTSSKRIQEIEKKLKKDSLSYTKYTDWRQSKGTINVDFSILLVDTAGILLTLYSISDMCYIGGGWEGSVHSTIEPAFFGLPILTGPDIGNSQDAIDLEKIGLVHIMSRCHYELVESWYASIVTSPKNEKIKKKVMEYIQKKSGATNRIYNQLAIL